MKHFFHKLFRSRTQRRLDYLGQRLDRLERSLGHVAHMAADVLEQNRLLREVYSPDSNKLILFMLPAMDIVSGGVVSICSLCSNYKT